MKWFGLLFLFSLSMKVSAENHYTVTYLASSQALNVNACLDNDISSLATGSRQPTPIIKLTSGSGWSLQKSSLVRSHVAPDCLTYEINLQQAVKHRLAYQVGESWLMNTQSWLYLPENGLVRLTFIDEQAVPMQISAPWREHNGDFMLGNTPRNWTSRIAFGDVTPEVRRLGDKKLNITVLDTRSKKRRYEYAEWLERAASAVSAIYGRFPQDNVQILVVPIGMQKEAVPWAEVQRNGSPAVHFFVDQHRPIEEFIDDWTATHELSHLLLPRIAYQDRWVSEGLASYYQYVALVQAGLLDPKQGWLKYTAGLARGRNKSGLPLTRAKNTRHTYWGGAAIFLLADIALRQHSQSQSLNSVMNTFAAQHLPSDELWSAQRLMTSLDKISHTTIFSQLLKTTATEPVFPISLDQEKSLNPLINKTVRAIFKTKD